MSVSRQDRVLELVQYRPRTREECCEYLPDIVPATIYGILGRLVRSGKIRSEETDVYSSRGGSPFVRYHAITDIEMIRALPTDGFLSKTWGDLPNEYSMYISQEHTAGRLV